MEISNVHYSSRDGKQVDEISFRLARMSPAEQRYVEAVLEKTLKQRPELACSVTTASGSEERREYRRKGWFASDDAIEYSIDRTGGRLSLSCKLPNDYPLTILCDMLGYDPKPELDDHAKSKLRHLASKNSKVRKILSGV